ncbi:MAG: hypothetical protein NVS3B20_15280 [Polyangiales bacterium]
MLQLRALGLTVAPMLAVIGVGSNLGDRMMQMRSAIDRLRDLPFVRATAVARLYETVPVSPIVQPDFFNTAVALSLDVPRSHRSLVQVCLAVEEELGRVREARWGPRTLDLDLLFTDADPTDHPDATVPHPRLHERAFALSPLLDLVPFATTPDGTPYSLILSRLGSVGIRVIPFVDAMRSTPAESRQTVPSGE